MAGKKATIVDIAESLGLSKSTVSRALTDSWEVSAETRQKVLEKAKELNYRPNAQARGLVTHSSHIIGYIVPDLLSSTYFTQVAKAAQEILLDEGYQLLITQSHESLEEERKLLNMMMSLNVDGIIMCAVTDSDYNRDLLDQIVSEGTPLVFVSRVCKSIKVPKIVVDNETIAERTVDHLVEQGCSKLAFVAGPEKLLSGSRVSGYRNGLEKHGLEFNPEMYVTSGLFIEDGFEATNRILDSGVVPDAIVAINDTVAFGVIKALKARGLDVPRDVAVCGFSNSFAATIVEPNLSSTIPPLEEMGHTAARLILHQLDGFAPSDSTIVLESEMVVRASSLRLHPEV